MTKIFKLLIVSMILSTIYSCNKKDDNPNPGNGNNNTNTNTNESANFTVSTIAGTGAEGSSNGNGDIATFKGPQAIAVDKSGNLFVVDASNNKIRKITPAGVVSTFAGTGAEGSDNGNGDAATFNFPRGIAIDANDNLYITDVFNNKIRKITPAGIVSTFAGTGDEGEKDGNGDIATFNYPRGITIDANGNLYVADRDNNKIRKITSAGVVSTLTGTGESGGKDGDKTSATLYSPTVLTCDANGNVYFIDWNHKIRKVSPNGNVSTYAGDGATGQASKLTFTNPEGIAIDTKGNLYLTDGNQIDKVTTTGSKNLIAGSQDEGEKDGLGSVATFRYLVGIVVDNNDVIYVTDYSNSKIRKIVKNNP